MSRQVAAALYVAVMVAVIVGVDVLFFRGSVLGTADGEYRDRLSVRSLLLEISQVLIGPHGAPFSALTLRGTT